MRSNIRKGDLAKNMSNKSMMRSNVSIKSTATTVNQERLAYVKKCRKLRGFALLESVFDPCYKTVRCALQCLAEHMSHEKVEMFKN